MTKFVTFISVLTLSITASAKPNYGLLSSELYPASQENQAFVSKFFDIVEAHKTQDPLLEGKGPSIREYSLDKIKFAFITNVTEDKIDLVFFNWKLPTFQGLETQKALSDIYGSTVYILKGVNKKSVASQGQDRSQLTNFSYMLGANTMEKQIKKDNPTFQVPPQMLDWKPNPNYMDRSHPLRQTLDGNTLVMLSPDKELFFKQTGMTEQMRPYFDQMLNSQGGFYNSIMGMMVHEMFHVKEGEDQVNGFATGRKINEDRKLIVEQLKSDANLRSLMATYVRIIFSIGDSSKNSSATSTELEQLADLRTVVTELKSKYSDTWKFIWNYEYTEGFAEYVSAYSMIQVGITSFDQQIELQKSDSGNNFAYRSGTMGGLYLVKRLNQMPYSNNEDHRESVWEIVLRLTTTKPSGKSIDEITSKYATVQGVDGENEVQRVIDYLISTVMN
jgi:hypothetical protein